MICDISCHHHLVHIRPFQICANTRKITLHLGYVGEEDPRCPIAGLDIPTSRARKACADANCPLNFKVQSYPHCHRPFLRKTKEREK